MDDKIGMEPVKAFEKIVEEINEMQIQTQMRKKLPVGIENFAEFSSENFYYVDKTMFIKEILLNWGKVNLSHEGCILRVNRSSFTDK